tara:strand:- start:229 stop:648 length:420 start_codon:yes stop_codon:yes gene_type:complete
LAGAALGSLLIAGFAQPPVLELRNRPPETATAMPVSTATLEALSVTDRTGIARGHVITVLRRPDDSIAALEIAWTGPDAIPGMTIEHAVGFLDYRPDANTIVAHQSWSELVAGYRAARVEPAPEPPRAGPIDAAGSVTG